MGKSGGEGKKEKKTAAQGVGDVQVRGGTCSRETVIYSQLNMPSKA